MLGFFLEVVKYKGFAGAARHLGMTGPALSKQVQSLEDQLGVRLLHRTTRQVTLTEEGALYNERARKALEDLEEAERLIQELKACPTGLLRINAPMSLGRRSLAGPIAEFASRYPEVVLDVDFDDRKVDIIAEGYDVVIRVGVLNDSSLIARKLADCPIFACASPGYIEQYGSPGEPKDLSSFSSIIYSRHGSMSDWRYISSEGKTGVVGLKKKIAANSDTMMLEACLHGLGIAILPIFSTADYLENGKLVRVLADYTTYPERGIYAMFPQNRHLSTKVRLFCGLDE